MTAFAYHLVDVFTDQRFGGNPLAVFPDAQGIPEPLLQKIAKELNLSETTFVLPPQDPANTCQVRIFTTNEELPMAGHPTVGTAYVLVREGLVPAPGIDFELHFEEKVGLIPVQVQRTSAGPGRITMQQPLPTFGEPLAQRGELAAVVGLTAEDLEPELPIQMVSCGVPFTLLPLRSRAILQRARLRLDLWDRHLAHSPGPSMLLCTKDPETPQGTFQVRMFAPNHGVLEDPATGGAAGPFGSYVVRHGWLPAAPETRLVVEQGFGMGRPSFLHVTLNAEGPQAIRRVRVGGDCVGIGRGELQL